MKMGLPLSCIILIHKRFVYHLHTASDNAMEIRGIQVIFTGGIN